MLHVVTLILDECKVKNQSEKMLIVFGGPENTTATKCFLFCCFLFLKRLNVARISVCVVFYNVTFLLCFLFRFDVVVFLKCLHIRGFDLLLSELSV